MKRDMDVVREILLEVESRDDGRAAVFDFDENALVKREHLRMLIEAGLLQEVGQTRSAARYKVQLSWKGHDYLDAIRDEGIWSKTKAAVAETGGSATLEIVKSLALGYLKSKIERHTGITL